MPHAWGDDLGLPDLGRGRTLCRRAIAGSQLAGPLDRQSVASERKLALGMQTPQLARIAPGQIHLCGFRWGHLDVRGGECAVCYIPDGDGWGRRPQGMWTDRTA